MRCRTLLVVAFSMLPSLLFAEAPATAEPAAAAAAVAPAAAPAASPAPEAANKEEEEKPYDFEHEEAFIDVPDALRSKQFVHRAILSTVIRDTAKVSLGGIYVDTLMGFNAIYQPSNRGGKSFAKYVSGAMGFAVGKSSAGGHSVELGADFSGVSTLMLGYRYFMRMEKRSFWPTIGFGLGTEIKSLQLANVPVEAQAYQGSTTEGYLSMGLLVPLVDVALKFDARFNFFGLDRLMLTTGAGAVFFL